MKKVFKIMTGVIIFNLINKIFGFLREIMIASNFGASVQTDAYNIAMTIPNIILMVFSAAISTSLIPIFIKAKQEGKETLNNLVNLIVNILSIISIIICILYFLSSDQIVHIIAPGLGENTFSLVLNLSKITIFNIVFITIISIFDALLYSYNMYNISAISECFLNIGICVFMMFNNNISIDQIVGIYLVILIIRVLFLYINLQKVGYKYNFNIKLNNQYFLDIYHLMIPVIFSSIILQINSIVDKALSSTLDEGSISSISYSTRIYTLFHSIIIYPIIKMLYPIMANLYTENKEKFQRGFLNLSKMFLILITPIWGVIFINSELIVKLIYGRGNFDRIAIQMTSNTLKCFSILLITFGLKDLIQIGFYCIKDTKTPSRNSILTVVLNICLSIILIKKYKIVGIALATSISISITTLILFIKLIKKINLKMSSLIKTSWHIILSLIGAIIVTHIIFNDVNLLNIKHAILYNFILLVIYCIFIIFPFLYKYKKLNILIINFKNLFDFLKIKWNSDEMVG